MATDSKEISLQPSHPWPLLRTSIPTLDDIPSVYSKIHLPFGTLTDFISGDLYCKGD